MVGAGIGIKQMDGMESIEGEREGQGGSVYLLA